MLRMKSAATTIEDTVRTASLQWPSPCAHAGLGLKVLWCMGLARGVLELPGGVHLSGMLQQCSLKFALA